MPAADAPGPPRDVSRMDDFEVIAERQRVMAGLDALTGRYWALNQEIQRRESLRWMLAADRPGQRAEQRGARPEGENRKPR